MHSFLNHPIKTLKEFFLFPTYISKKDDFLPVCFFSEDKKAFLKQFSKHKSKSLVAIGYCSKPYNSQDKRLCCPSGRFNHRCMFLENINLKANSFSYPSTVCKECIIGKVGKEVIAAGYPFYIMTSAMDIAKDVFSFPFKRAILTLCPYSSTIILYPLRIFNIEAIIFQYISGDCRTYKEFDLADRGIKRDTTNLSMIDLKEFLKIVEEISYDKFFVKVKREGNFLIGDWD